MRERVERLDKHLHDLLACASVQGDEFFAQAVAKAQQVDCGGLIDLLDEQLARKHQLIVDHGGKDFPNGARVHTFSFRHNLLREYVYGKISKTEKEYLHAKIGAALEEICQPEHVSCRSCFAEILVDMQSYQDAVPHLDKARTAFAIGKHYALGETMLYLGKAHLGLDRRA